MTEVEFLDWRRQEETIIFFRYLSRLHQSILQDWSRGHFTSSHMDGTLQQNAEAIGKATQLEDLQETTYNDITQHIPQHD